MLDPTLRALFVAVLVAIFKVVADRFGIPVDDAVLTSIAIVIIAWIFGQPAGHATAQAIQDYRQARARKE